MKSVSVAIKDVKQKIKPEIKSVFITTIVLGIITHMVAMVSDMPNHDGLASMYFDQNMITSGRWFLGTACGISSYYTIPWFIGLLSVLYIGVTAVILVKLLGVENPFIAGVIGAILVTYPSMASTFAYVFTMDGYMIGLLLAVLSVYLTSRFKWGWIAGAVCLAFSMGTYQAYLPIAIVLCMYSVILIMSGEGKVKDKVFSVLRFLYMGIGGAGLYYIILQILLKIQGKALDTYQGINGLESSMSAGSLLSIIPTMYKDFLHFTIYSKLLVTNVFCLIGFIVLAVITIAVFIRTVTIRKWYKSIWLYVYSFVFIAIFPIAMNVVLAISSGVNYHLIMRLQWALIPILMLAFCDRFGKHLSEKFRSFFSWGIAISGIIIILCYMICDNIAYSNLSRKYEKTYAYCERLLDRIEQTEGYYQGIPVAIMGVVGSDPYPVTDITEPVTGYMIGITGDYFVYKHEDYESFIKNYLGATLNTISTEEVGKIYYSDEYKAMESFPGKTSTKVVNGILYVKTENLNLED